MVTVLALVTINEDNPFALAAYFKATDPLLHKAGAKIVKRFEIKDVVVGKISSRTAIIVEYPSREAVNSVFGSDEYAAVIPMRDIAFSNYTVTIIDDVTEVLAS